jgi:hypothetical protein
MGFFTYRQAKKSKKAARATKREVHALRQQEARTAAATARTAATRRAEDLFQQLPPEGKAEYRRIEEEARGVGRVGRANVKRHRGLVEEMRELFRRYDLVP